MQIDTIKQEILSVLHQYSIRRAGIFGSLTTGQFNEESDIDLLVETDTNLTLFDFLRIKYELEDKLGRKVDLVEYDSVKPQLKNAIMEQEIRIYG